MQIQTKSLSPAKRDALRKVLDHDGFPALIEVLESEAFKYEAHAANSAIGGTSGYDALAKSHAEKAIQVHSVIKFLNTLKDQTKEQEFLIYTATPNSKS